MAHAICRTDKMFGTYNPAGLVNIKATGNLDNGAVVVIGAMATGEREAYTYSTPTTTTKLGDIALIISPEVMYLDSEKKLADFYNKTGEIMRGFRLHAGDEFSITADGLTGTPNVGNAVELAAGTKLKTATTATSGSTQVGTIVAHEGDFWVVRVVG